MINLLSKTGLGRSGHDGSQSFGQIWYVSGPEMVLWRNDIMILHHFCRRSSKITLFWPKPLIFDQKSKKIQKIRQIPKNPGFPRTPCGDPCGDPCRDPCLVAWLMPPTPFAQYHKHIESVKIGLAKARSSKTCWNIHSKPENAGRYEKILKSPHRSPPRNPRNPLIFVYFSGFLGYFRDFGSNIRVFGPGEVGIV